MHLPLFLGVKHGFHRVDLLVALGVLGLLAAVTWPALGNTRARSFVIECLNNLRQVGQACHQWADDHGDLYTWQVEAYRGGTRTGGTVDHFTNMFRQFDSPRFLVCPSDNAKAIARSYDSLTAANVSYFLGITASLPQSRTWLCGDRNLNDLWSSTICFAPGGSSGIQSNSTLRWTRDIHVNAGNLLLGDGSVHQVSQRNLVRLADLASAQHTNGVVCIQRP